MGARTLQPNSLLRISAVVLSHLCCRCKFALELTFQQSPCGQIVPHKYLLDQSWAASFQEALSYAFAPAVQDCQVGLNFAEQQEAEAFRNAVVGKINQRSNRQGTTLLSLKPTQWVLYFVITVCSIREQYPKVCLDKDNNAVICSKNCLQR